MGQHEAALINHYSKESARTENHGFVGSAGGRMNISVLECRIIGIARLIFRYRITEKEARDAAQSPSVDRAESTA